MATREQRARKESERRSNRMARLRLDVEELHAMEIAETNIYLICTTGEKVQVPENIKGLVLGMLRADMDIELKLLEVAETKAKERVTLAGEGMRREEKMSLAGGEAC